jgi:hypothetical protein
MENGTQKGGVQNIFHIEDKIQKNNCAISKDLMLRDQSCHS